MDISHKDIIISTDFMKKNKIPNSHMIMLKKTKEGAYMVFENKDGKILEYGLYIPLGPLHSFRDIKL